MDFLTSSEDSLAPDIAFFQSPTTRVYWAFLISLSVKEWICRHPPVGCLYHGTPFCALKGCRDYCLILWFQFYRGVHHQSWASFESYAQDIISCSSLPTVSIFKKILPSNQQAVPVCQAQVDPIDHLLSIDVLLRLMWSQIIFDLAVIGSFMHCTSLCVSPSWWPLTHSMYLCLSW